MRTILCSLLALVVLLAGCGNITKGKGAAQAQVAVFHKQFNDQKIDTIISSADSEMFQSTSKADATDFINVVHTKLGKVTDTKNVNWNIQQFNTTTTVTLVQNTKFEKGSGTETFTFRIKKGKACLAGYYVNSRDLIMK